MLEVHPATGIVHAGEEKKKDSNKARILVGGMIRRTLPSLISGVLGWRFAIFSPTYH